MNDALASADHYNWKVQMDSSSYGRVRAIMRPDGATYVYARAVTAVGTTSTITTWNQGEVRQIVRTPSDQLASSQFQRSDGSWESPITYGTSAAGQPPSSYTEPNVGVTVPSRTTSVTRDPVTYMVTQRSFPDGGSEAFTYNGFNEPLSHVDQLSNVSAWTYDTKWQHAHAHRRQRGTSVSATESWTYSGSTAGSAACC